MILFSGNANIPLAKEIASHLKIPLGRAVVGKFSDDEIRVEIEDDVRGQDVFVIQSTSAPANDNLMELLIMIDALRRASANKIVAVIPYLGYARQDRRPRLSRTPITAKVVAQMIGADAVITMDLHSDQIQGFFDIPVEHTYGSPVLLADIWKQGYEDLMVVSPDVGGVVRARALAIRLGGVDLAIIDKRRTNPNESEVMHIIGDVKGRSCLIVDDMVDTAGTLCKAANALKANGAKKVLAYCTHPVLSGQAIYNIDHSSLDEVVVTNTIPLGLLARHCKKIRQLSVANILAETIHRMFNNKSVSSLFMD